MTPKQERALRRDIEATHDSIEDELAVLKQQHDNIEEQIAPLYAEQLSIELKMDALKAELHAKRTKLALFLKEREVTK